MTASALIDSYFEAWNRHDGPALVRLFARDGTYEDPSTGAPIPAARLPEEVSRLAALFPDLCLERRSSIFVEGRGVVEWVMRGKNLGPLREGVNPTEKEIALSGATVFELDGSGLSRVRVYFDQKTLFEQMGLMALVQPIEQGAARFGYSMRVPSGNPRPPGVIALTWIQGANEEEKDRIRAHSRENVKDFVEEPGFISIVTGFTGLRGFTVTAWEDEAAMKRALSKNHAKAMRELFGENFVASVWTSVWTPTRMNRLWVRCPSCGSLEDVNDDHRRCVGCAAPLPERPAFW